MSILYCPNDMIAVPTKFIELDTVHKDSKLGQFLSVEDKYRTREKNLSIFHSYTKMVLLKDVLLNETIDITNILDNISSSADKGRFYEAMWEIVIMLGYLEEYNTRTVYDLYPYKMENECFLLGDKIQLASYLDTETIQSGNKRGISDITLREKKKGAEIEKKWACERHFYKETDKQEHIVFFSSKFYEQEKAPTKYDIEQIFILAENKKSKCPIYSYKIVLLVKNKKHFLKKLERSTKDYYLSSITDIFDLNDLNDRVKRMRLEKDSILESLHKEKKEKKPSLSIRFHQLLVVNKTIDLISEETKDGLKPITNISGEGNRVLWGQIARSGKTFSSGLLISKLYNGRFFENIDKIKNIILVITPAPSETSTQFTEELFKKYSEFQDFTTYIYDQKLHKKYKELRFTLEDDKKYIFVVSKQFLQGYNEEEELYANKDTIAERCSLFIKRVALLFFDEIHYGGSTDIANTIINTIRPLIQIYLTATYKKPYQRYNISKDALLIWSINDIQYCKTIHKDESKEQLYNIHGYGNVMKTLEEMCLYYQCTMYELYTIIEKEYQKYPNIHILTSMFQQDKLKGIFKESTEYGFDMNKLFELQEDKQTFINDGSIQNLLSYISNDIYSRIERIQHENMQVDRFTSQLWFLPYFRNNRIRNIAPTLEQYIKSHKDYTDYEVISVLKKEDKEYIRKKELEAFLQGKKGIIILAGKKLSLGVSLPCTDVVLFLNNDSEVDVIYQRMFRSLTERDGKKVGFVIDINPIRIITATIDYSFSPKDYHSMFPMLDKQKDTFKKMIENNVIYIDEDLFSMNKYKISITELYTKVNTMLQDTDYIRVTQYMDHIISSSIDKVFEDFDISKWKDIVATRAKKKTKHILVETSQDIPIPKDREASPPQSKKKEDSESQMLIDLAKALYEKKQAIKEAWKDVLVIIALLDETKKEYFIIEILKSLIKYIHDHPYLDIKGCSIGTGDSLQLEIWKQIFCVKFSPLIGKTSQFSERIITIIEYLLSDSSRQEDVNKIFLSCKDILMNINTENPGNLHAYVEKYLPPKEHEKKEYGEVFTPLSLVREMLDGITTYADSKFWNNPDLKILDPAAGIGNFPLIAYEKLMKGLERKIPKEEARRKHILENMLYMIELNPVNVRIMKRIFNDKKYNLNIIRGDALDEKTHKKLFEKAGTEKFDLVMGNPPFQDANGASNGTLWDKFILTYINIVYPNGYLAFITPSGWRNVIGKFKELQHVMIRDNQLIYLEIHNEKDGLKIFNSETRYDWYIIKHIPSTGDVSTIKFQDGSIKKIKTKSLEFIPNGKIDVIMPLFAKKEDETCEVMHSDSLYEIRKSWMSKTKDTQHKYPCVYTVDFKDNPTLYWSSKKETMFGIPKLIWSNGRISSLGSIIDNTGKYALTQFSYAIVDEPKNLPLIKKAFDSEAFRKLMEYCAVSQNTINYKVIALFKKDFWKQFL